MKSHLFAAVAVLASSLSTASHAQPTLNPPMVGGAPAVAEAPPAIAPTKPAGYRTAKYTGGEGATWKTGRDAYGFMGSFGGCRYSGHAGKGGYKIDKVC